MKIVQFPVKCFVITFHGLNKSSKVRLYDINMYLKLGNKILSIFVSKHQHRNRYNFKINFIEMLE